MLAAVGIAGTRLLALIFTSGPVTYFWDEWALAREALNRSLPDFSLSQENGYWAPLSRVAGWFLVRAFPFEATPAIALSLSLLAILFALTWWMLGRFSLTPSARVALFAWFCWSPLLTMPSIWWSVAIGLLPAAIATLLAFRLVDQTSLSVGTSWTAGIILAIALLFTPVAMPAAVFIVAWTATYRRNRGASLIGLLVPVFAWLMAYVSQGQRTVPFEPWISAPAVFSESWAGVFMLSIVGGPWKWAAGMLPWFADTPSPLVFLITLGLVVTVVLLYASRATSRRILIPWGLAILANCVQLLWTSVTAFGPELVRQGRYWLILLIPTTLAMAALIRDCGPWSKQIRRLALAVVVVTVASSVITTVTLARQLERESGKRWLENAANGLAHNPGVNIQDTWAPSSLISVVFWPDLALASSVLAQQSLQQTFDRPSTEAPWIFDSQGRLIQVPFTPSGVTRYGCVPIGSEPRELGLAPFPYTSAAIARVQLNVRAAGRVQFINGSRSWEITAPEGESWWFLPRVDPVQPLEVQGEAQGCITAEVSGQLAVP